MKKIRYTIISILFVGALLGQQNPTGNPPGSNSANTTARSAWYRGGNFNGGIAGDNNIFGTMWNSPIYTYTNGTMRSILNGTRFETIDGYPNINTSGFMGLGGNSATTTEGTGSLWPNVGPFSLLHLNYNT